MSHNLANTLAFIGYLVFVGFMAWYFNSGWWVLLIMLLTFRTDKEIEDRSSRKEK